MLVILTLYSMFYFLLRGYLFDKIRETGDFQTWKELHTLITKRKFIVLMIPIVGEMYILYLMILAAFDHLKYRW